MTRDTEHWFSRVVLALENELVVVLPMVLQ
jgi:hypothetical protein